MILDIQPDLPVPIYEQIVAQVIYGVASGALPPGTMIPSIRDLASQLVLNPNTVARATQELERRGVLAARRGRGMEVTPEGPELCAKERQEIIRTRLRKVLREAVSSQLEADSLRQLIAEEYSRANGQRHRPAKEKRQ